MSSLEIPWLKLGTIQISLKNITKEFCILVHSVFTFSPVRGNWKHIQKDVMWEVLQVMKSIEMTRCLCLSSMQNNKKYILKTYVTLPSCSWITKISHMRSKHFIFMSCVSGKTMGIISWAIFQRRKTLIRLTICLVSWFCHHGKGSATENSWLILAINFRKSRRNRDLLRSLWVISDTALMWAIGLTEFWLFC